MFRKKKSFSTISMKLLRIRKKKLKSNSRIAVPPLQYYKILYNIQLYLNFYILNFTLGEHNLFLKGNELLQNIF